MRELHVVAVSEDGRHAVLATRRGSTKGAYKVALDATLAAALRGDLPRPGADQVPELSPKEIQARLRSGESVAAIARSAGVPEARVQRYAGPVQGEMARVIDATRAAHVVRGRLGRSAVDLGTAVDAALEHGGADTSDWTTYRQDDGSWRVTVRWSARKRSRSASWLWDPATKTVTGADTASTTLAHQEAPGAPVRKPAARAAKPPAAKPAAAKPAAKKAAPTPATKKAAQPVAAKPAAKRAPAKKPAAAPVAARPAAKKAAAAGRPTPAKARLRVVPDPEPQRPASRQPTPSKPSKQQRASVPAWADVLLGTTPGGDR